MDGLILLSPEIFTDQRGEFFESYNQREMQHFGIEDLFVQDNQSKSKKGVLRGLHYQKKYSQAQIVRVIEGEIFDVAVNINQQSPCFGKYAGVKLSDTNRKMFYMSKDYAHGFLVLSDVAVVLYKCSQFYHPEDEGGIIYNDPDIAIKWPLESIQKLYIAEKDLAYKKLGELFS